MRSKWRGEGRAGDDRGEVQAQASRSVMEWQVGVAGSEEAKGLGLLAGHLGICSSRGTVSHSLVCVL